MVNTLLTSLAEWETATVTNNSLYIHSSVYNMQISPKLSELDL